MAGERPRSAPGPSSERCAQWLARSSDRAASRGQRGADREAAMHRGGSGSDIPRPTPGTALRSGFLTFRLPRVAPSIWKLSEVQYADDLIPRGYVRRVCDLFKELRRGVIPLTGNMHAVHLIMRCGLPVVHKLSRGRRRRISRSWFEGSSA